MNRKTKKKLEALGRKLQVLRQKLAGARRQSDDPSEVEGLAAETAAVEAEIKRLKES